MMGGLGFPELFVALSIFALYFLPAIIANSRKHKNKKTIITLNILLGWTGIGWFACLIWSFIDKKI